MTKPSLDSYCREKGIMINLRFGLDYSKGKKKDQTKELGINFMDLTTIIEGIALANQRPGNASKTGR
jgi:hypothetical protein